MGGFKENQLELILWNSPFSSSVEVMVEHDINTNLYSTFSGWS